MRLRTLAAFAIALLCSLGASAQRTNWEKLLHDLNSNSKYNGRELVVTMRRPGELAKKLTPADCERINFLRVNGPMGKTDLILLTELAKRKQTMNREGKMVPARIDLDLQNAFVVDEAHLSLFDSQPRYVDVFDSYFKNCTGLRSIILPNNLVEIGRYAFQGCTNLEYVYIPDRVRVIGSNAFEGATRLYNADMPNGIESIGDYAFSRCSDMKDIALPNRLRHIGNSAFSSTGLKSIILPEGLEHIGNNAFSSTQISQISIPSTVTSLTRATFGSCGYLTHINISYENPNYCDIDGVVFSKDKKTLIYCPYARKGIYAVPEGTEGIAPAAFYYSNATEVVIPNSCTWIGEEAFCSSRINIINLPANVKEIARKTFDECGDLQRATLPPHLEVIGNEAFRGCKKLADVSIPNTVRTIGEEAFRACFLFNEIVIPESVQAVGEKAFYYCKNAKQIVMLGSVPPAAKKPSNQEKKVTLVVPAGSLEAYKKAPGWSDIRKITEAQ